MRRAFPPVADSTATESYRSTVRDVVRLRRQSFDEGNPSLETNTLHVLAADFVNEIGRPPCWRAHQKIAQSHKVTATDSLPMAYFDRAATKFGTGWDSYWVYKNRRALREQHSQPRRVIWVW